MSAFGNDCHFFYNAACVKGDSCPFRHCEAAKATDITCTFWRQKTCTKPNCPFRHSEGVIQNKNRAEIPCYWETQPVGCTKTACPFKHQNARSESPVTSDEVSTPGVDAPPSPVVEVQPVVVNLAEDSDVEMTSPVKTLAMERKAVPMKAVKQLITAPRSETAIQKHRPSIHSRLNARGPSPVSRTLVKERLKMGTPDTSQPNSVKARLGVNKPDTSIKNRLGVQQQMENSEKSNADDAGEGGALEVKSLEQIQRDKALRSMGLIELKGGKIMKIADWEREQKGHNSFQQSEEEEEESEENNEETDEEDESSGEDEKEEEEEEEEEEEDDLEEPEEIELFASDEPEHEEDTRTFVSTGDTKKMVAKSKSESKIVTKNEEETRGGRRIVVEDSNPVDDSTPDIKASLKRRLGGRVTEVPREPIKSVGEISIKKRLTMPIGSSNQGTIKTVTGIKSRLGTASNETATLDARQKLKPRQTVTLKNTGLTGITLSTSRESNEESKEAKERLENPPVRKRGWRKTTKVTVDGSDTDGSRPVTPDQSLSVHSSPEKSTVTEEGVSQVMKRQKKEEDGGAKLQNMLTQRMRNNSVWSNRNAPKSRGAGETLDSLGIGIIDIKGGKVVKIGKNKKEENKETKREDKLLAQIEKLSKVSKRETKERKVYIPPALKKAGIDVPDAVKSRGSVDNSEIDADEHSQDDPKVMTFSEIMAAKRQRQKRLAEKRNADVARKKSKDTLELPQEDFEDSNEAPADVLKIAQMITGSLDDTATSEESRHHHRSKKKSKWRKKRKASKEKKDHQQSDTEKDSAQDRLKTVDKVLSEDSQNSSFVSSKNPLESDEPDLKRINQQKPETVEDKMSDKEDISPTKKKVEQLLSDSWFDLDVDNIEGETGSQDEDDLLREIDELLA